MSTGQEVWEGAWEGARHDEDDRRDTEGAGAMTWELVASCVLRVWCELGATGGRRPRGFTINQSSSNLHVCLVSCASASASLGCPAPSCNRTWVCLVGLRVTLVSGQLSIVCLKAPCHVHCFYSFSTSPICHSTCASPASPSPLCFSFRLRARFRSTQANVATSEPTQVFILRLCQ